MNVASLSLSRPLDMLLCPNLTLSGILYSLLFMPDLYYVSKIIITQMHSNVNFGCNDPKIWIDGSV